MNIKEKIYSFGKLKEGWNYGEGMQIKDSTIDNAISLIEQANKVGFHETNAFPGCNGEIMCSICVDEHYLEFDINAVGINTDSKVTFAHELKDEEVYYQEGLSLQEAKEKITEFHKEFANEYKQILKE